MPMIPAPTMLLTRLEDAPSIDDFFLGMDRLVRLAWFAEPEGEEAGGASVSSGAGLLWLPLVALPFPSAAATAASSSS